LKFLFIIKLFCFLRRTHLESPNDSEYYATDSIIDKIKSIYGKRKDKLIIVQEKEDENCVKTEIVNEKIKDDELLKTENIYVKTCPFNENNKEEETIYETINEYDHLESEVPQNSNNTSENTQDIAIYSTPTNKVLSNDERKMFVQQQQQQKNSSESSS
jgi:hypothetical protein